MRVIISFVWRVNIVKFSKKMCLGMRPVNSRTIKPISPWINNIYGQNSFGSGERSEKIGKTRKNISNLGKQTAQWGSLELTLGGYSDADPTWTSPSLSNSQLGTGNWHRERKSNKFLSFCNFFDLALTGACYTVLQECRRLNISVQQKRYCRRFMLLIFLTLFTRFNGLLLK